MNLSDDYLNNFLRYLNISHMNISLKELRMGCYVELEHGTMNPITNITDDDPLLTIKIALAHLMENPKYYSILKSVGL